jgi:hypothetical protein
LRQSTITNLRYCKWCGTAPPVSGKGTFLYLNPLPIPPQKADLVQRLAIKSGSNSPSRDIVIPKGWLPRQGCWSFLQYRSKTPVCFIENSSPATWEKKSLGLQGCRALSETLATFQPQWSNLCSRRFAARSVLSGSPCCRHCTVQ